MVTFLGDGLWFQVNSGTDWTAQTFQRAGTVEVAWTESWICGKFVTGMAEKAEELEKNVERLEKERADSAERPAFAMGFLDVAMDWQ